MLSVKEMLNMKDIFITVAKGLWIGGTLTVPGVSGGAMAMILNIYDRLVFSLNSLFRRGAWAQKKKSLLFLLAAAAGGLSGFVIFSKLVGLLLEAFPVHVCFLFVGAIAGGIPAVLASAGIKRIRFLDVLFVAIGVGIVSLVSLIPDGLFATENAHGLGGILIQMLGGVVVAFGLVLPGISMSQMLYVFGIYEDIIHRVSSLDILPLIPFAVGGIVGTLATSFAVEKVLARFPRQAYLMIFGFLLGSIPQMFRGLSLSATGWVDWIVFAVLLAAGGALVMAMFLLESRKTKQLSEKTKVVEE